MREIKFRAWDKTTKEMREIEGIDFQYQVIGYLFDEDVGSLDFSETELMQYTGLKDKNGVEIYEGDIVDIHYFFEDEGNVIGVVGVVGVNGMGTYIKTEDGEYFLVQYWVEPEEELEVIGNIYEHAELLKESK